MPLKAQNIWTAVFIGLVIGVIGLTLWFNLWLNKEVVSTQRPAAPADQPKGLEPVSEPLVDPASFQQPQSLPSLEPAPIIEVQAELVQKELVQTEPVKEEPIQEEPIKEEPVQEEVVKEEPINQEPPAMAAVGSSQAQSASAAENNAPADESSFGVTETSKRPSADKMQELRQQDIVIY